MNDLDTVTLMTHSITYDSCEVTNPQIQMDADLPTFLAYCLHIPNVIPYLQQTYLTDFSNVNMMVADALAPIWCQGICNHHTDFVCSASNPSTSGMFHHNILVYPIIIPQFICNINWINLIHRSYLSHGWCNFLQSLISRRKPIFTSFQSYTELTFYWL